MITTSTGAIRSSMYGEGKFPLRYDLILKNPEMLKALAETYGEGMEKYGRDNWKKGFPESVLMQHAMQHLISYANGDESEPHLGHALWNIATILWVREHKPELLDLTGPDPGPSKEPEGVPTKPSSEMLRALQTNYKDNRPRFPDNK